MINLQALHTDPKTWGSDSLTWRPSRWLASAQPRKTSSLPPSSQDTATGNTAATEALLEPVRGTFAPWSDGSPRVCPGRKIAQVEFVAVMVALFRAHRVRPVLRAGGETTEAARQRLQDILEDSRITSITLQMRRPRDAALEWVRV